MIARMRTIADAEGIAIDDAGLGAIAYRADGGLRDALTMLEQVAAFAGGAAIGPAVVDAAFGTTGREYALALRDAALGGDAAGALRTIDDASDAGTDMAGLIRALIAEFRHLLVARVNPELLRRDLATEDAEAAQARAGEVSQARLVRALRLFGDALWSARNSGNPRLELETALLRFVLQHEDPTLEALAARVGALEGGAMQAPAPAAPATSAAAAPKRSALRSAPPSAPPAAATTAPPTRPVTLPPIGGLTVAKVRSLWQSVRARAESEKGSIAASLGRASIDAANDDAITLRVPDRITADALKGSLDVLRRAVEGVIGRAVDVQIAIGAAATGDSDADAESPDEHPDDVAQYAFDRLL